MTFGNSDVSVPCVVMISEVNDFDVSAPFCTLHLSVACVVIAFLSPSTCEVETIVAVGISVPFPDCDTADEGSKASDIVCAFGSFKDDDAEVVDLGITCEVETDVSSF